MSKNNYLKQGSFDYFVRGLDFWRRDILDRLDKIETTLRLKHQCILCGFGHDKPDPFYGTTISREIWRKLNLTGTAGDWTCGRCGKPRSIGCCDSLVSTPDLPLHARVAKALGKEVALVSGNIYKMLNMDWPKTIFPWIDIPAYDTDLVAAWDAFDIYCKQNDLMWKIERTHTGQGYIGLREIHAGWDISEEGDKVVMYRLKGETLAENFCEAIVKHAEQQ